MTTIREAPEFRPSLEEWTESSPLAYLEKVVRPQAEHAGICKIVPPEGWIPPFSVDNTKLKFPTRTQHSNNLEGGSRISALFDEKLRKFRFGQAQPLPRKTSGTSNSSIDWCAFYREVMRLGGGREVDAKNLWDSLRLVFSKNPTCFKQLATYSSSELCSLYRDTLQQFEDEVKLGEAGFKTRVKREPRSTANTRRSPKRAAISGATKGSRGSESGGRGSKIGEEATLAAANLRNGTTPLHSTNNNRAEAAVPASSKRAKLDESASHRKKGAELELGVAAPLDSVIEMFSVQPRLPKVGDTLWKWFDDEEQCLLGTVRSSFKAADRKTVIWKVRYQQGNRHFERDEEETELALTIACGNSPEEAKEAFDNGVCQRCNRAHAVESLLVCDSCTYRFHEECLFESDQSYGPEMNWFCPICMATLAEGDDVDEDDEDSAEDLEALRAKIKLSPVCEAIGVHALADYGFPDGESFTVEEYVANDKTFRSKYEKQSGKKFSDLNEEGLENEFWRIARNGCGTKVEVNYGNDLDTAALGSGFPTQDRLDKNAKKLEKMEVFQRRQLEEYAASPWNLNNLPTSEGSLLQHVEGNISGIIVPWLYMGMTFSAFCFHVEDHNFASINYHHMGAPKSWWGCSAEGADSFEAAAKEICPELFEARPDLLQGIVKQFDPEQLAARGVPMYHVVQRPGEYIITFPRAYHGGFNHGYNCAEAVNFATRGWLGFGAQAVARYSALRKTPVIAHEALLISIASYCFREEERSNESVRVSVLLQRPFSLMIAEEKERRAHIESIVRKEQSHDWDKFCLWKRPQDVQHLMPHTNNDRSAKRSRGSRQRVTSFKRSVNVMGRMQALAGAFDSVPQCRICKRYCSLSYGILRHRGDSNQPETVISEIRCLEHAPSSCTFIQVHDIETLDSFAVKLGNKSMPIERWVERANRLFRGEKQPDDALGELESGGLPFDHGPNDSPLADRLFSKKEDWKCKPSFEAVRKLLGLLPNDKLLEEAGDIRQAFTLCEKAFYSKMDSQKKKRPSLAELEAILDGVLNLPLTVPDEIIQQVRQKRDEALEWRERACVILGLAKDEHSLVPSGEAIVGMGNQKLISYDILLQMKQLMEEGSSNLQVDIAELSEIKKLVTEEEWLMKA